MEIKYAQTAVTKAYDNDLIDGHCLKAFRKTKRLLQKNANVRKTTVSIKQYLNLIVVSDDSLTRAMDQYTKWFDGEVFSASVDQNVDQNVSDR